MKKTAAVLAALMLAASGAAVAQSKSIKEANDHYRSQQKAAEVKRQNDNRMVQKHYETQRYNNSRPSTSTPQRSYTPPPRPSYTPPPPRPSYTPPSNNNSYKRK